MRRMQPITKKAKISSTTHVHCYNGYMVDYNNTETAIAYWKKKNEGEKG